MKAISRLLAVLAVLLLTGCGEKDHPVRTSLVVDTSTMTLSIGESAVRMATSKAEDAVITYTSSNPAVATVDDNGTVHAVVPGEATITATAGDKTATCKVTVTTKPAAIVTSAPTATPGIIVAGSSTSLAQVRPAAVR